MNKKEFCLLIEEWNKYLFESSYYTSNISSELVKDLFESCQDLYNKLKEKNEEKYFHWYITKEMEKVANKHNLSGASIKGGYRLVYSSPNEDWVLKIAKNLDGAMLLGREVEISKGKHGLGARNYFTRIYDWDGKEEERKGEWRHCYWIISEKVIPLRDIKDIDILKRVFPTFWNAIEDEDKKDIFSIRFLAIISKVLKDLVLDIKRDKKQGEIIPKFSKFSFYNSLENHIKVKNYNEIFFDEDIKVFMKMFSYIQTNDINPNNFGIVDLESPTPDGIRILDFDITI